MDRLPEELVLMIFSQLDLIDLIDKKSVCKRWLHLIDQIKFKELVIVNHSKSFDYTWFHTYKPISTKFMLIDYLNLNHFNYESFRYNFYNLQFFKINYLMEDQIEQLNHFHRLVHLEIDNLPRLSDQKVLNLKCLKVFKFQLGLSKGCIHVMSDRLQTLSIVNLNQINPLNPNSLKHLEVDYCNESNKNVDQLNNLEVLIYKKIGLNQDFSALKLPRNLKQLHFHSYDQVSCEDLSKLRNVFNSILSFLDASMLRVFFEGIELSKYKRDLTNYGFNLRDDFFHDYTLKLIHMNYESTADTLPERFEINYNDLEQVFTNLPENFFTKFNNITSVYASQSVDQDKFGLFLSKCKNLSNVSLFCLKLDQNFLDQLCNYSLKEFNLSEESKLLINYEFLFKFKSLFKFRTSQNLTINFIMQIMYRLKFLKDLEFYCLDTLVKIKKTDINLYDLKVGRKKFSTKYHSYPDILIDELFYLIGKL